MGVNVNRNDAIGGLLVLLFSMLTVGLSLKMPLGTFRAAGPGLFPLCLGILLAMLSSIFTFGTMMRLHRDGKGGGKPLEIAGSAMPVIGFMAVIAFAAGFLERLGYAPTAFIVVMALLQLLGWSYWRRNLAISLAASAVSHFIFVTWLQIPFPKGWLGL